MVKNGFTKKKIGSLTLGEKLRKIRSERRLSLKEISKSTRIQNKYLEYLENGEYDKLPPNVYVKGFLKSYANYLGVDENYLLKLYDREKGIQANLKGNDGNQKDRTNEPIKLSRFIITPKVLLVSGGIALVVLGFLYLFHEIDNFISTPHLVVTKPIEGETIEEKSTYVSGITEKNSQVFINDQPILVNDSGEFNENVSLQKGLNTVTVKSKNKFNKESVKTISIRANYQDAETNVADSSRMENQEKPKLELEIYVNQNPTWISVETDGVLVYSGTLLPQAVQSFRAEEKISITSGKGNNTNVKINGKDLGALSDNPGVVRNVTFNADTRY